jgi:hypothetical protein
MVLVELDHYIMCEELDPKWFQREATTILRLQQTLNLTCVKTKKKDTSEEHEKDRISSYTIIVSKKKKKTMIMEMFLPYTSC